MWGKSLEVCVTQNGRAGRHSALCEGIMGKSWREQEDSPATKPAYLLTTHSPVQQWWDGRLVNYPVSLYWLLCCREIWWAWRVQEGVFMHSEDILKQIFKATRLSEPLCVSLSSFSRANPGVMLMRSDTAEASWGHRGAFPSPNTNKGL